MLKRVVSICVLLWLLLSAQAAHAQRPDGEMSFDELGWVLLSEETFGSLKFGMPTADLLEAIGEPTEESEAVEWGADGQIHQWWRYPEIGLVFDIVGEGNKRTVNSIEAAAPCRLATGRGVAIGSDAADVYNCYRRYLDPGFFPSGIENAESLIAGGIYGGIIFSLDENGKVVGIFFGAAAD